MSEKIILPALEKRDPYAENVTHRKSGPMRDRRRKKKWQDEIDEEDYVKEEKIKKKKYDRNDE